MLEPVLNHIKDSLDGKTLLRQRRYDTLLMVGFQLVFLNKLLYVVMFLAILHLLTDINDVIFEIFDHWCFEYERFHDAVYLQLQSLCFVSLEHIQIFGDLRVKTINKAIMVIYGGVHDWVIFL